MRKKYNLGVLLLIVVLVLAACTGADGSESAADAGSVETAVLPEAGTETQSDSMEGGDDDGSMAEEGMGHDDESSAESSETMNEPTHDDDMASESSETMHDDDMASDPENSTADAMSDEEMMDPAAETAADAEMPSEPVEAASDIMMRPVWQELALTNARTGETFTLADFAGKTIFVEPMATWCTNCRHQLTNVRQARADLNAEDVVFIALSLETNISGAELASYAEAQGFDWLFAVMTPEILQELADEFGRSITSAPSTPHFIVRPDGTYTELVTGIDSPQEITTQLLAAQG